MKAKEVECVTLALLVASLVTSAHPGRSNLLRSSAGTSTMQVIHANNNDRIGDAVRETHADAQMNIHTRSNNHVVLGKKSTVPKEKEELENYFPIVSVLLPRIRERKSWMIATPNFLAEKIYWVSRDRGEVKDTKSLHPRRSVETMPPDPYTELARNTESVLLQRLARSEHAAHTEKLTPNSQTTKPVEQTHSRTEASESTSPTQVIDYGIPPESSGNGDGLERNGDVTVAVEASQKSENVGPDITEDTEQQGEAVFFWSWEAAVIVSIPILCVAFLLLLGFLTRTYLGVRVYRFLKWRTTFNLELSRRIGLDLEEPHVFRTAEAVTDQGEAKSGACVGVDLKYDSSSESYVSYFDADGSLESFDSQYGSEGDLEHCPGSCTSSRKPGRKGSGDSGTSRRGSTESQRSQLRLWGRRKGSGDSRASTDSQLSLSRRGSEESQRSFMKMWYAAGRKGSADSQVSNDAQSLSSRRGSSDSQRRQMAERHGSLDSSYGSLGSREGQDGGSENGGRTKRRDSPKYLESTLQEVALYSAGRSKSLDLVEERRASRTLSLIHEEDKDEHHP